MLLCDYSESHGTTQLPLPPTETSSLMDEKEKNYQLETSIVDCKRTRNPHHNSNEQGDPLPCLWRKVPNCQNIWI